MKNTFKTVLILILVVYLCMALAACAAGPVPAPPAPTARTAPAQQPNAPSGDSELVVPGEPAKEPITEPGGALTTRPASGFPAEAKIPGGVYLTCLDWSTTVVSLTKDGEQLIPGGHSWYFDLEKKAREVAGETEMNIYALDGMYKNAPQEPLHKVPFSNLSAYQTRDGVIDWIAVGGDWQPFPCIVSFQKYSLEDQPPNQEWTDHFAKLLKERIPDTPVIITEAWFFDLDGDGKNEAFVNAGNALPTEKGAGANPPPGKQTGVYSLCALFSQSLGIVDLDSNISAVNQDFTGKDVHAAYAEPVGEKYYETFVSAIQYGENGEYIQSPIFNIGEYEPPPRSYPIVCDIDGDGSAELLRFREMIYGPLNVYSAQGGKLTLRYSIAVSA